MIDFKELGLNPGDVRGNKKVSKRYADGRYTWIDAATTPDLESDWVFSTDGFNADAGSKVVVQVGHTINVTHQGPGSESLYAAVNGDWATLAGSFSPPAGWTVGAGQAGVSAGADVVRLIADSGNTNFIVATGGPDAPQQVEVFNTYADVPPANTVAVGRLALVSNDIDPDLRGLHHAFGPVGAAVSLGWEKAA